MLIVTPSVPGLPPSFRPSHIDFDPDDRTGASELEVASRILSHAVNHLVSQQLAGQRPCLSANRDAIAILCSAGRDLAVIERRDPARRAIAAWLRGSSLVRALRPCPDSSH